MTSSGLPEAHHNNHTSPALELRILALGGAAGALYLASIWATRSIYSDRAPPGFAVGVGHAATLATPWLDAALYGVVTILLFVVYLAVLSMCRRGALTGRARGWALSIPCIISIFLAVSIPVLSEDVFSYMAHGFLGVIPHGNPLLMPADAAAHTAIGPALRQYGWHGEIGITPYGIVWTRIEVALMRWCGTDVALALILLKAVVAAASLATAYFIWIFLGHVRPAAQLFGTLAYLWNPLILAEFAGEGHNDAVMVLFVVAGLAACAARRPKLSMVAQMMGFLTKYVSLLFFPAQLVFLWHTRVSVRRLALDIALAVAVSGVLAAALYGSLWAGSHSFMGLLNRGQPISSAAPFGAINWLLRRSPLQAFNGPLTLAAVTLPLLAYVAWVSLRVKDAADLAWACAWISVGYTLLTSPDYWPWYACMPVALLVLADAEGLLWFIVVLSLTARLGAPLDLIYDHGFLSFPVAKGGLTGLGSTVPALVLLAWLFLKRRRALPASV